MSDPYVPFQKGPLKNTARVYPNPNNSSKHSAVCREKTSMKTKGTAHREQVRVACAASSGFRVCGLTEAKPL